MERQNEMLREHLNGSFRDLLVGILKDPAMLVYLDNGENLKDHPNENFGRGCSSCSPWVSATIRSSTPAKPRGRSEGGPTTFYSPL